MEEEEEEDKEHIEEEEEDAFFDKFYKICKMAKSHCFLCTKMGLKRGKIFKTKGFYAPCTHVPCS